MLFSKDVKKSFAAPDGSRLPVLEIPDFCLGDGEQMALVGRSGCGKTTLLHVIAGISRPDAGSVKIDGMDLCLMTESDATASAPNTSAMCFQTFNLLPGFTALENVLLGMRFAGGRTDPARAKKLLERVGVAHRLHHKPAMLSVGEQQRVAVARALANRPKLLLADEPTANVDTGHQTQVFELLRDTCRRRTWPCCWSPTARSWPHVCRGSINWNTSTARCHHEPLEDCLAEHRATGVGLRADGLFHGPGRGAGGHRAGHPPGRRPVVPPQRRKATT